MMSELVLENKRPEITIRIVVLQTAGGFKASGETGGGTKHFADMTRVWAKVPGVEVYLVTNTDDHGIAGYDPAVRLSVASAVSLPYSLQIFLNFFAQVKELDRVISAIPQFPSPLILVAPSPFPSDVLATLFFAKRYSVKGVVYFHHIPPPPWWFPRRRGAIRAMVNWIVGQCALAVCKVAGLGVSVDNLRCMRSSKWKLSTGILVDEEFLTSSLKDLTPSASRPVTASFIGRLAKSKGVLDLIRAWKVVVDSRPMVKLVVAGNFGSERMRRDIYDLIRRYGLGSTIELKGFLSENEKESLLSSSRLFIHPSYEEGWSYITMEAAAHGALPVTYDLPAYDYLGPSAARVPVGDYRSLARAILALLDDDKAIEGRALAVKLMLARYTADSVPATQLSELLSFSQSSVFLGDK